MMFRERPRALCARALARFSHVPGAAGRDRGARVVTGGAKRTRRREDPTEPECGDVRTDLSQWWHSRTNPSARGYPNALISWRLHERTRGVRVPNEPESCASKGTRARASERADRGRVHERIEALPSPNEPERSGSPTRLELQPSCTNEPERRAAGPTNSTFNRVARTNPSGSEIRTNPSRALAKRTRAVRKSGPREGQGGVSDGASR